MTLVDFMMYIKQCRRRIGLLKSIGCSHATGYHRVKEGKESVNNTGVQKIIIMDLMDIIDIGPDDHQSINDQNEMVSYLSRNGELSVSSYGHSNIYPIHPPALVQFCLYILTRENKIVPLGTCLISATFPAALV